MRLSNILIITTSAIISLTACATSNISDGPLLPVESSTQKKFTYALNSGQNVTPNWWENFDDKELVYWVELALKNNRSLDVAQANITGAELLVKSAKIGKSFSALSSTGAEYGRSIGSSAAGSTFTGNLGASWEWDVFNRLDSQLSAAKFNRDAIIQAHRDVAVVVASNTAQAYLDFQGAKAQLTVARRNADVQGKSLQLVKDLVENGRSSDLDLYRSENLYRTTLASMPEFEADIRIAIAQLGTLTGQSTQTVNDRLSENKRIFSIPKHPTELASGSPQDLINRRPDIRQAAANIAAQFALTEFEKSRLYPRIIFNVDGDSLFNQSNVLSQLGNFGYGFGPTISWEGPDLRSVRTDINISESDTQAAISQYEQIVLDAMSDVEASLATYSQELQRTEDLRLAARSAEKALELAQLRYDEGFDDFLDVLDAQRTLLDAEEQLVQHEVLVTSFAISVYRALGGMWTDEELASGSLTRLNTLNNSKDKRHDT